MPSNTKRTYRRRQLRRRKMGKARRRELRKNPPKHLPLDEAPSGAETRSK